MITVRRVHTEHGSHIEPALDTTWDNLAKLRWSAAVVAHDTGLTIEVEGATVSVRRFGRWHVVPDSYNINIAGSCAGGYGFRDAWAYLNGVRAGVKAVS